MLPRRLGPGLLALIVGLAVASLRMNMVYLGAATSVLSGMQTAATIIPTSPVADPLKMMECNFPEHAHVESPITLVTAFWDIGRAQHDGRTSSSYVDWLLKSVSLLDNSTILILGNSNTTERVKETTKTMTTRYICTVTMDFQDHEYYKLFYEENRRVVTSEAYLNRIQNAERIEVTNPKYSILQWSKMGSLDVARRLDPFNSEYFIWVDAGLSRFWPTKVIDKEEVPQRLLPGQSWPALTEAHRIFSSETRLVLSMANQGPAWIISRTCDKVGNGMWYSMSFLAGFIFGGSKKVIENHNKQVKQFLHESLTVRNESANDQIMFMAMLCEKPKSFRLMYTRKINLGEGRLRFTSLLDPNATQYIDPITLKKMDCSDPETC